MCKLDYKNKVSNNKIIIITIILFCLSIGQIIFIFSNSLLDRENSSNNSGVVRQAMQSAVDAATKNTTNHIELTEHFVRKCAHFTEFFVLGILLCVLFIASYYYFYTKKNTNGNHNFFKFFNKPKVWKIFGTSICVSLIIAASDELLQLISQRAPMLQDVLLDISSAFLGIAVILIFLIVVCRSKLSKNIN